MAPRARSFNPRARVGRDRPLTSVQTWLRSFNPRARVGRDRLLDNWLIIKDKVNAFCEHYKK